MSRMYVQQSFSRSVALNSMKFSSTPVSGYVIPPYVEEQAEEFKKLNLVALKKDRFELVAS
jgi:hypothetical protein